MYACSKVSKYLLNLQEEFQLALFKNRKRENLFANRVRTDFQIITTALFSYIYIYVRVCLSSEWFKLIVIDPNKIFKFCEHVMLVGLKFISCINCSVLRNLLNWSSRAKVVVSLVYFLVDLIFDFFL